MKKPSFGWVFLDIKIAVRYNDIYPRIYSFPRQTWLTLVYDVGSSFTH